MKDNPVSRGAERLAGKVREPFQREREDAKSSGLDPGIIGVIALLALYAVVEDLVSAMMALSFYSTLQPEDFVTYHPVTPWFHISGALAFMYVVHRKGMMYWLLYAVPSILIAHSLVLLALIHGFLDPSDLQVFDFGPSWWRGGP